jgi:energy-coupling factor transporter ATP-binding protein EcfA2
MAALLFGFMPALDPVRTVLVLYGPTGSGKSTVTRLLQRFVPKHVQASIPPDMWSNGYHLVNLQGVLLNAVTELELTGRAIRGAVFKLVASHEPVTARQIRQEPVTFTPRAMHLFACNQLPTIGEGDRSLERRLMVIAVPKMADDVEVNPNFLEEAWEQAAGIVNLMVQEVEAMAETGRFRLPPDNPNLVVRMQYPDRPEEHVARLWLEPAAGERVWSTELQAAIRIEAEALGIDTAKWQSSSNMKALSIRISKLYGATRHMTEGRVFYSGVRFTQKYAEILRGLGDGISTDGMECQSARKRDPLSASKRDPGVAACAGSP